MTRKIRNLIGLADSGMVRPVSFLPFFRFRFAMPPVRTCPPKNSVRESEEPRLSRYGVSGTNDGSPRRACHQIPASSVERRSGEAKLLRGRNAVPEHASYTIKEIPLPTSSDTIISKHVPRGKLCATLLHARHSGMAEESRPVRAAFQKRAES